jgi:hypothetical protein
VSETDRVAVVDFLSSSALFASLANDETADPGIDEQALDALIRAAGGREPTLNHLRVLDAVGRYEFRTFEQLVAAVDAAIRTGTHVSEEQQGALRSFLHAHPTLLPSVMDLASTSSPAAPLPFTGLELDRLFSCRRPIGASSPLGGDAGGGSGWLVVQSLLGDLLRAGRHSFRSVPELLLAVELVSGGGSPVGEADREALVELLCEFPVLNMGAEGEEAELEADDIDALWMVTGASTILARESMQHFVAQSATFNSLPALTNAVKLLRAQTKATAATVPATIVPAMLTAATAAAPTATPEIAAAALPAAAP